MKSSIEWLFNLLVRWPTLHEVLSPVRPLTLRRKGRLMSRALLIADDSPSVRSALKTVVFNDSVFDVYVEAVDGMDALRKASETNPDVVILDLRMPEINGLGVAKLLRSAFPATPIILFTMYADLITPHDTQSAGLSAVFSKANVAGLVEYIRNLFRPQAI